MTLESAYKKLSGIVNPRRINDVVELAKGYVFMVDDIDQPIYVDDKKMYGLNGNNPKDRRILNVVYRIRRADGSEYPRRG